MVVEEGTRTLDRIDEISKVIDDSKLKQARYKLESAMLLNPSEVETEKSQEAMEKVLEAKRILAQVRKEHLKEIRQIDFDHVISLFNEHVQQNARPSEVSAFNHLAKTAQRSIDGNNKDFEHHLDGLRSKNFEILWRQDWYVIDHFKEAIRCPHLFVDKHRFDELSKTGKRLIRDDDIENLRSIVAQLYSIMTGGGSDNSMAEIANIIRG